MPKTGRKFSVKMNNMKKVGWVSNQTGGYRYQKYHPITNKKWPEISNNILAIWHELTKLKDVPDESLNILLSYAANFISICA